LGNPGFFLQNTIGCPYVCCHRNILLMQQFEENLNVGEDTELWVRITKSYPFFLLDQATFLINDHSERTVNLKISNSVKNHLKTLKLIQIRNKDILPAILIKEKLSLAWLSYCKYYIFQNKRFYAFLAVAYSLMIFPGGIFFKFRINLLLQLINIIKPLSQIIKLIEE
jgi:hypothetical protein